jgi:hypothetical protein
LSHAHGQARTRHEQEGRRRLPLPRSLGADLLGQYHARQEDGHRRLDGSQIKIAITNGVRKDGAKMLPPMAVNWYKNITREDLNAIVAYRRTLKPLPAVRKVRHIPPKKK